MPDNARGRQDLASRSDKVYAAALRYLARREYAESELKMRLLRRGADEGAVAETLSRLKEQGYLDEDRFARSRVRQRRDFGGRGRALVRAELISLGLDSDTIEEAISEEYDGEIEAEIIRSLAEKEIAAIAACPDPEQRKRRLQALKRRLLMRGFNAERVFSAVEQAVFRLNEE